MTSGRNHPTDRAGGGSRGGAPARWRHARRCRRGAFTLVETLLALVLAMAAVTLLGGLEPLAEVAEALGRRRVALRAAENLRATWPGGRVPVQRRVPAEAWADLAPDDARAWQADASGWGPWAEAGAPGWGAAGTEGGAWAEVASGPTVFELVLVGGNDGGPRDEGQGIPGDSGPDGSSWIVVSWPVYEGRGGWVERARRQRRSLAVNGLSR